MGAFDYIPVIALACYTFLFLVFLAAKKNRIVTSYLFVILASMVWTGGSFFMRIQLWPSYQFWYHVSLGGLLYLAYALFYFVNAFSGQRRPGFCKFWFLLLTAGFVANIPTGIFLKWPDLVLVDGNAVFVYEMSWTVGVLFAIAAGIMFHMIYIIVTNCKKDPVFRKQIEPTLAGIVLMFSGNLALLIPALKGFPIDILCCLLNAGLMFYALTKRRLFRLKMLTSEAVCYGASLIASVILFYNLSPRFLSFLKAYFPRLGGSNSTLVLGCLFLIVSLLFMLVWKKFLNAVFIKEDRMKQECLQQFSLTVSKSLRIRDIYEEITRAVKASTEADSVYICMQDHRDAPFSTVHTDKPLADNSFFLRADSPIVARLQEGDEGLFLKEFRYSVAYKAMWDSEKKLLAGLGVEYIQPLKDQGELVGIILLSHKNGKSRISADDVAFLAALASVASIAIKNSMLYEQAYREAVTDELTGLYNRKHFNAKMEELFLSCKKSSLVLVLINVDDFKLYNQLYGMAEGDRALQRIARVITASIGENGVAARYSGKEFAILLPHYDVLAAKKLTESISRQIYSLNESGGEYSIKRLTISAGISAYPYGASTPKELLDNVDLSVYHAKRSGKNAIRVFGTTVNGVKKLEESGAPKYIYQEYESTVFALTAAIDTKDHYTFRHSNNVAYYATSLGEALGMNQDTIEMLRQAALLHDVGKIGIPESILNKPGRLTEEEFGVVKGHVEASIGIIKHLPSLDYVIPAVTGHHERYDGGGYPRGIAGENIPLTARILCVADSFDAMVSKRCYKPGIPLKRVMEILREEAGKQFDPRLVEAFLSLLASGRVKVAADESSLKDLPPQ